MSATGYTVNYTNTVPAPPEPTIGGDVDYVLKMVREIEHDLATAKNLLTGECEPAEPISGAANQPIPCIHGRLGSVVGSLERALNHKNRILQKLGN